MNKPLADAIAWAEQWNPLGTVTRKHMDVLLAAARAQVPRDPTEAMQLAALKVTDSEGITARANVVIWKAMYDAAIAAAPINTEGRR